MSVYVTANTVQHKPQYIITTTITSLLQFNSDWPKLLWLFRMFLLKRANMLYKGLVERSNKKVWSNICLWNGISDHWNWKNRVTQKDMVIVSLLYPLVWLLCLSDVRLGAGQWGVRRCRGFWGGGLCLCLPQPIVGSKFKAFVEHGQIYVPTHADESNCSTITLDERNTQTQYIGLLLKNAYIVIL